MHEGFNSSYYHNIMGKANQSPAGQRFWHPDMPRYLLLRPGPDQLNSARTKTIYHRPKINKFQTTTNREYTLQWSNNIIQHGIWANSLTPLINLSLILQVEPNFLTCNVMFSLVCESKVGFSISVLTKIHRWFLICRIENDGHWVSYDHTLEGTGLCLGITAYAGPLFYTLYLTIKTFTSHQCWLLHVRTVSIVSTLTACTCNRHLISYALLAWALSASRLCSMSCVFHRGSTLATSPDAPWGCFLSGSSLTFGYWLWHPLYNFFWIWFDGWSYLPRGSILLQFVRNKLNRNCYVHLLYDSVGEVYSHIWILGELILWFSLNLIPWYSLGIQSCYSGLNKSNNHTSTYRSLFALGDTETVKSAQNLITLSLKLRACLTGTHSMLDPWHTCRRTFKQATTNARANTCCSTKKHPILSWKTKFTALCVLWEDLWMEKNWFLMIIMASTF